MKRINVYASSNRVYTASVETVDREGNGSGREFAKPGEDVIDAIAQAAYLAARGGDCVCLPFLGRSVGYSLLYQDDAKALALWKTIKEGEVGD